MALASFLRTWFRRSPQRLVCRLQLEALEERCVPAGGSSTASAAPPIDPPADGNSANATGANTSGSTGTGNTGNTGSPAAATGTGSATLPNGVGVFNPANATWYLRSNLSAGAPTITPFQYGEANWVPVWGDWNGDGTKTLGIFDPNTATWYLKNSNSPGAPDIKVQYGEPGWVPVVGDWTGDGKDTIGVFNPNTATWYLRDSNTAGAPDITPFQYGGPGWTPVVGDWNGDGRDSIGIYNPGNATWYLKNTPAQGAPDYGPIQYGVANWTPVVGDWSSSGDTGIGVYSPTGTWYLRNTPTQGPPSVSPFQYGGSAWRAFFLPSNTAPTNATGPTNNSSPPINTGVAPTTPASVSLVAPTTGAAPSVNLTVTASAGSGAALDGTVNIDVDLNHDGQFSGAGELNYTGLINGTYKIRARVGLVDGTELTSTTQTMVWSTPSSSTPSVNFEVNEGQTDSQALFVARTQSYTAFITQQGIATSALVANPALPNAALTPLVASLQFVGANSNATPTGQQLQRGVSNYLIGNDPTQWHTAIPNYGQVVESNLYPNVNLVYHGNNGQLEFDVDVNPGANLSAIGLTSNNGALSIGNGGQLVLTQPNGVVGVSALIAYQVVNGVKVAMQSSYVLVGPNTLGFQVVGYDPTKQLVIDPMVNYASYLGGTLADSGNGIGVDAAGDAYVVGTSSSIEFPTSVPFQTMNAVATDAVVTEVAPNGGGLIYSTYLGGSANDQGLGIAVDAAGNAYVTGMTASPNFPTTPGVIQTTNAGGNDAFVAEVAVGGTGLLYSTYLGGAQNDQGNAIAIDGSGDAFVTGSTNSNNFPTTGSAFQATAPGGGDAFVTEVNPTGTALVYSTYLGGSGNDQGNAIALDSAGVAYVAGSTSSLDFPTTAGVVQPNYGGGPEDGFVVKVDPSGSSLKWSTYLGGSGDDRVNGITVDQGANVYVAGTTNSTDYPTTDSVFRLDAQGGNDMFVTKLSSDASSLVYSTYIGGTGDDRGNAIALDQFDDAFVGGQAGDNTFPTYLPTQAAFGGGASDGAVVVLDPIGRNLLFSTFLGGSGQDAVNGIAVDGARNVYVAGTTTSIDFPVLNAFQAANGGVNDIFVAQFSGIPLPPTPVTTSNQFSPNNSSDAATDFGALTSTTISFNNLTIYLEPNGLYSQAWFKVSASLTGTLNVDMTNIAAVGNGGLQLRVFVLNSDGSLTDIGDSLTVNALTQTVSVGATQGQEYYVWVEGLNYSTGFYDLAMNIT